MVIIQPTAILNTYLFPDTAFLHKTCITKMAIAVTEF